MLTTSPGRENTLTTDPSPADIGPAWRGKGRRHLGVVSVSSLDAWEAGLGEPSMRILDGDARATHLESSSVDLVVTSPPYWKKRDYGHADQIGQEPTPKAYVKSMMDSLQEWKRVLRRTGSVFL